MRLPRCSTDGPLDTDGLPVPDDGAVKLLDQLGTDKSGEPTDYRDSKRVSGLSVLAVYTYRVPQNRRG